MKSILIIIPYFGPFPKQFEFWLQSAHDNPSVDFLLFTDQELVSRDNVKTVSMPFSQMKNLIQAKFDFPITILSPYKLCDFKSAYGYIFDDYVKDYNFWGFGDLDLVYGAIRHFFTDAILSNFKIISGWGHLTLYENSEFCNNFFQTKLEGFQYYKDSFTEPKNTVFDEYLHGGMSDLFNHLHPNLIYNQRPFDDILVPRLSFNFISVFHPLVSKNLIFEYHNGNLYRIFTNESNQIVREPTLYAHFQQRKFMKVQTNHKNHYLIIPNSYIDYSTVTIAKLIKWCKPQILNRNYWNFKNRVNRRFKLIFSK
jgi:hypothetical protein